MITLQLIYFLSKLLKTCTYRYFFALTKIENKGLGVALQDIYDIDSGSKYHLIKL